MTVRISFDYEPDEPDEKNSTGMSEDEYERVMDALAQLGAIDIDIKQKS